MNPLPVPVPVSGCGKCVEFQRELRAVEPQTSAETDIRVLWRRHQNAEHGITVPGVLTHDGQ